MTRSFFSRVLTYKSVVCFCTQIWLQQIKSKLFSKSNTLYFPVKNNRARTCLCDWKVVCRSLEQDLFLYSQSEVKYERRPRTYHKADSMSVSERDNLLVLKFYLCHELRACVTFTRLSSLSLLL